MQYVIKPTPQFERDYKRAAGKGLDLAPLNAVITALAAGESLPTENRDRPLGGGLSGCRECKAGPNRLLIYRLDGEVQELHLLRVGSRGEVYRREGVNAMKPAKALKTLVRSPLKTAVTLLLLAAAAFLFLYNLGEYAVSDREYREARDQYEGVLTVEEQPPADNPYIYDFFLMTDETGRSDSYGTVYGGNLAATYESCHQQSLGAELVDKLAALPHITRVERRYLTAGVSADYTRLDTDIHYFPYSARAVLTGTVTYRFPSHLMDMTESLNKYFPEYETYDQLILEDVELL